MMTKKTIICGEQYEAKLVKVAKAASELAGFFDIACKASL